MDSYRRMSSDAERSANRSNADIDRMINSAMCSTVFGGGILFVGVLVTSSVIYDETAADSRVVLVGPVMIAAGLLALIKGSIQCKREQKCKCLNRHHSTMGDLNNAVHVCQQEEHSSSQLDAASPCFSMPIAESPPSYEVAQRCRSPVMVVCPTTPNSIQQFDNLHRDAVPNSYPPSPPPPPYECAIGASTSAPSATTGSHVINQTHSSHVCNALM